MIIELPRRFFLVKGVGEGSTFLTAFDAALLDSGIGNTNLLKVSSILPPGCEEVSFIPIPPGSLLPVAYASLTSDKEGELISAGVAVAIPSDRTRPGLIMEVAGREGKDKVEKRAVEMVREGMDKRGEKDFRILSIAVEHRVIRVGAVFAAVVLWK